MSSNTRHHAPLRAVIARQPAEVARRIRLWSIRSPQPARVDSRPARPRCRQFAQKRPAPAPDLFGRVPTTSSPIRPSRPPRRRSRWNAAGRSTDTSRRPPGPAPPPCSAVAPPARRRFGGPPLARSIRSRARSAVMGLNWSTSTPISSSHWPPSESRGRPRHPPRALRQNLHRGRDALGQKEAEPHRQEDHHQGDIDKHQQGQILALDRALLDLQPLGTPSAPPSSGGAAGPGFAPRTCRLRPRPPSGGAGPNRGSAPRPRGCPRSRLAR